MKKGVLSKVLAVVLAAAVLCGTGFTAVGQFVGTDVFVSADEVYGDFDFLQIHKKIRQGNDPCHYAVMNAGGGTRTHSLHFLINIKHNRQLSHNKNNNRYYYNIFLRVCHNVMSDIC